MIQSKIRAAAFIVLAITSLGLAAEPISVMPLGDSITAGSDGGYRKPLVEKLTKDHHFTVSTVGSQTDTSLPEGQQAHEGHGGWRLDQLADNLLGHNGVDAGSHGGHWIKGGTDTGRGPIKPTYITISAGINDINQMIGESPASPMSAREKQIMNTLQTRLKKLVGTLSDNLPDSTLLLGGCIPYNNGLLNEKLTGATEANRTKWAKEDGVNPLQEPGVNHWVLKFNKWIRDTYVPELQKQGKKVQYVDVYSRFILPDGTVRGWNNQEPENSQGPSGYADFGLHPNQFGYKVMADAWAEAIAKDAEK